MSQPELRDQAARTAAATDLTTTYLVEAAAGTGKTTLLVSRILAAVRRGVRLTEMVAITFTEKAAGELKQRLRTELEKQRTQPLAARALEDLERAQVSTIHSFCAWLLKERPVEAGVDPQFGVADALQQQLLLEEAWNDWLPREAATEKSDANPLRRLLAAEMDLGRLWELAQVFVHERERCRALLLEGEPPGELSAPVAAAARQEPRPPSRRRTSAIILGDLQERVARLGELRPACSSVVPDKLANAIDEWQRLFASFDGGDSPEFAGEVLTAPALSEAEGKSFGDKRKWKPAEHYSACRRLGDAIERLRLELSDGLLRDTLTWLRGFLARYDALKRQRVLLDFDDLLRLTRDLLQRAKNVRGELQRRFQYIFVDEFQDTDPLQTEIVFFLAENGAHADEWQRCALVPGKLFLVGDPKQSIYGFRRADIELYQSVARQLKVLTISTNFRSRSTLLGWVNDVFRQLIRRPADGDYQPQYVALEAAAKNVSDQPAVWKLAPAADAAFDKKADARVLEADAVARCLRAVHDRDRHAWRDMAVLFCTTTALEQFTAAFRRYDVPHRIVGGRDFYVRQEVLTLASLLCCLDNPADKLNLVAVLRSPLFGWSDEQIFLSNRETELDYLSGQPTDARCAAAFALLRELHAKRQALSVAAFTETAMNATKICEAFFAKPEGEQAVLNLLKALDLARALEAAGERTVRAVVRRLRRSVLESWDEESSPATEEGDDVVRLLTVHKAKGLEFSVVVMADLAGASQDQNVAILHDAATSRIEARLGKRKTAGFDAANQRQALRDAAEEIRLLYVAATRAKQLLVVPWFVPDKKPGRAEHLAAALETLGDGAMRTRTADEFTAQPSEEPPLRVALVPDAPADGRTQARIDWHNDRATLLARAATPRVRLSPSKLAGEVEPVVDETPPGVAREQAMEFGSVVHAALERMDAATIAASALSATEKRRATEMVTRALDSDLMRRVQSAEQVFRELPFAVATPDGLLEGKIDLLFCENGRWVLVDFKTDKRAAVEPYRAQMQAYVAALRQVAGITVSDVVLFFVATGEVKRLA